MRKIMKKSAAILTTTAIMCSFMQFSVKAEVAADMNFNDSTGTLELVNPSNYSDYTYQAVYEPGASGRESDDISYSSQLLAAPHTIADAEGFVIPYYAFVVNSADTVRTLEISIKYNAGADYAKLCSYISANPESWSWNTVVDFVSFQDGKIFVNNKETGMIAKPDEWYRIVIEEHYNAADTRVYINGQVFDPGLGNYIFGNRWTQVLAGMNATGEEGTRDVSMTVDDIKIYDSAYEPTGDEAVEYTITGDLNYGESLRGFFVDDTVTVDEILNSIDTSCEKYMIDSLSSNTIKDSGTVENGNVVVIRSADGKTFEYLYVYTSEESKIVDQDSFKESSTYTMFGDATYAGKRVSTGIYGRESDDYSFDMYTNEVPGNVESANRYNFMADNNVCSADSFTKEFSIGADGNFDEVLFIVRSTYTDSEGGSVYGYKEPFKFKKDGTIDINNDRVLQTAEFRENQWYRIAITIYPAECKYDLYINNEKILSKEWLSTDDELWDSDKYDITSLYWFQIQPLYKANEEDADTLKSGHVYVDDTITYYGEYMEKAENDVSVVTDYEIDNKAGTIKVPEGTDISAFVDKVDFGSASAVLYTDNTYTAQVDEWLSDGNILVIRSENGKVFRYYTVTIEAEDEFRIDDKIDLKITPAEGDTPAKAKASINVHVPENDQPKDMVFAVASYKDGVLQSVEYVTDNVIGDKLLEAEMDIEDTEGVTVKAMLWNNLMTPYIVSASL